MATQNEPQLPATPLKVAVVGHTNTGKTSLLRTLTRNPEFGEVNDSPGTTRHVEGIQLLIGETPVIEFFDTPGIEDAIGLADYIDRLCPREERLDAWERIDRFLDSVESRRRFEQEARVLKKMLEVDAALYVIDTRDPMLSKHKEELATLASCGRPILPVLNFTRHKYQRVDEWREGLTRLAMHAIVEFDTVAPPLDGEDQLYERLAVLLDRHAATLKTLQDNIRTQRQQRRQEANRLLAELLVDVAALRISTPANPAALEETTTVLRDLVRQREQHCLQALLTHYNFRREDFLQHTLPLEGERWGMDLFSPQTLKEAGIEVGKGAAAGAAAGFTVDLITAGLSLGSGTLIGAAVGGAWQGLDRFGKRLLGKLRGYQEVTVDNTVIRLLAARQMALIQALEQRGHAARDPITIDIDRVAGFHDAQLPETLVETRSNPQWSTLGDTFEPSVRRQRLIERLAQTLGDGPNPEGQIT
ncbi:MAG: GTPase/DUF3482 domain-containing protein [Pusillimonas sp.]